MGNYCEECGNYTSPLGPLSHECVSRTENKTIEQLKGKHIELCARLYASEEREQALREALESIHSLIIRFDYRDRAAVLAGELLPITNAALSKKSKELK